MQENSTRSSEQECIDVIDKLHEMAHAGAFHSMNADLLAKVTKFLHIFFDVDVTLKQASEMLHIPQSTLRVRISRRLTDKEKPKRTWLMPFSSVLKLVNRK